MKNIFIVIVLAVVVGLGVYVIGNKQVLAPQEQPQICNGNWGRNTKPTDATKYNNIL